VLSGPAIERLEAAPIEQVVITNTIPLNNERARGCTKIKQLSVARLLGQAIRSINEETSVSSLFV
jgi:ribose-phosphate pyrophosphokinase